MLSMGPDDLLFEVGACLVGDVMGSRGSVSKAGFAFGVEAFEPSVRALAGDAHGFGDMRDGHALIADTRHQQALSALSEAGVTVRHEDLRGFVKTAISTMPRGSPLFSDRCHQPRDSIQLVGEVRLESVHRLVHQSGPVGTPTAAS